MSSKIWKVIAVLMAAAMIASVGAGCAGNENGQESSASSASSSKDESNSETSEESKTKSAEDSKLSEESKTEVSEESKEDSTEESTEESVGSTDEVSKDYSGYAAFFGSWEHAVADEYYAFELYENGTGKYRYKSGNDIDLRWTVEEGKLCLRALGGLETFEYVDGRLKDTENSREYIKVDTLYVDTKTDADTEAETSDYSGYSAFFGSWEYNVGGTYYAFEIYDNGTGKYRYESGNDIDFRWTVEEGKLCIRVAGGLETFEYVDGKLRDTENPREYLKVDKLSIDS